LSTGAGPILAANSYCIGKLCLAASASSENALTQHHPHHDGLPDLRSLLCRSVRADTRR